MHHVAELAVHGHEALRLGHRDQRAQLPLAGVPADVDRLGPRVDDLGAPAVQVVDDLAHRPLVARDRVGADDHDVVLADAQPLVLARGHERQGRHGLALRAGRDHAHLARGQAVHVLDVDLHAVGDADDAQPRAELDVLAHGPAERGHLAAVGHGGIDDLLHPVHVAGEAGHDDALAGLGGEDPAQRHADRGFRFGKAGLLRVGGVRQEEADALGLGELPHACHVGAPAVDRLQVELEVARVQDHALRGVERDGHRLGHRVRDRDELDVAGRRSSPSRRPPPR